MSDLPEIPDAARDYFSAIGRRGAASLHSGTTIEQRRASTAAARAARAARPTTRERIALLAAEIERLSAVADEVPALRAEVAHLRQLVAA